MMNEPSYTAQLNALLRDGRALIIVPPFARVDRPSLAVHILQACARQAGIRASVLYANVLLAAAIGMKNYLLFSDPRGDMAIMALLGERLFARGAHDLPPLGKWADRMWDVSLLLESDKARQLDSKLFSPGEATLDIAYLEWLEEKATLWADEVAAAVASLSFEVVGCTTTFEQTNASLALLKRIKRLQPQIVTIIGGANCEGEMAQGMASLDPNSAYLDYIFSGESETTFPAFLQDLFSGQSPAQRIIHGAPCCNLDAIPTPDFTEYFEQRDQYLSDVEALRDNTWLSYETSRGCWWGQKKKCTFCGLSDESKAFRAKSPQRILDELAVFIKRHAMRQVSMTDQIMPRAYFKTLLPRMTAELPPLKMWYEQKANLSLEQVLALKRAGIVSIQPGIEALSTLLLKRMDKGVLARQNVRLLRYARSAGLHLMWNLLWGFPGDALPSYQETLALLPLIHHLQPPDRMYHIWLDRFSMYFDHPERYGISHIKPLTSYYAVLPSHAQVEKVAYRFMGDYESASRQNPDIIEEILRQVVAWQKSWAAGTRSDAVLLVARTDDGYLLIDKRGLPGTQMTQRLDRTQASTALVARPYLETEEIAWALDQKIGIVLDSWYVPLTTARPELLLEFEQAYRKERAQPPQGSSSGRG